MMEAKYYEILDNNRVKCLLCPHNCIIKNGFYGNCKSRINKDGKLYSTIYGKIAALHLDPIEKKPLIHFFPNSRIFSVGTTGCNLHCKFCQNYEISQSYMEDMDERFVETLTPKELVDLARSYKENIGIAFTYNEPFIWFEYILEVAKLAKAYNLKTVMVTNGFVNPDPLKELNHYIDAYSIDLKGYDNFFYKDLTGGEIDPVVKNIEYVIKSGKHVEIDYLVIPNHNDDLKKFRELMIYYEEHFGKEIVLHINRYFPRYQMKEEATKKEVLLGLEKIAKEYLTHVYVGNI